MKYRVSAVLLALLLLLGGCAFEEDSPSLESKQTAPSPVLTEGAETAESSALTELSMTEPVFSETTLLPETVRTDAPKTEPLQTEETTVQTTSSIPATPVPVQTVPPPVSPAETTASAKPPAHLPGETLLRGYTYYQLSPELQEAYDLILAAAQNHQPAVRFRKGIPLKTLSKLYSALLWEEPVSMYLDGSSYAYSSDPVTYMELRYSHTKEEAEQMEERLNQRITEIFSRRPAGASAFDLALYFHDTIISGCTYDVNASECETAYGALVNGKALCQGYSQAMALLCRRAGIENCLVTGYAGEEHMWNLVRLDTGWYHIDVTWDDPGIDGKYDSLVYDYFGLTDGEFSSRTVYTDWIAAYPAANSTVENYFVKKGLYADSYNQAAEILYREFLKAVNSGKTKVYLRLSSDAVYQETCEKLFEQQGIFSIQQKASNAASRSFSHDRTVYMQNPAMRTLVFDVIY